MLLFTIWISLIGGKDESSATIGVDFRVCKLEVCIKIPRHSHDALTNLQVGGRRVKLSIWVRLRSDDTLPKRIAQCTSLGHRGSALILI